MRIQELTLKENTIREYVQGLHGTIEEKAKCIHENGIPEQYKKIHIAYTENAVNDPEALKRALFIQWSALSEPLFLTGIGDLDPTTKKAVIQIIDGLISNNSLDEELNWMLKYYCNWEWIFDEFHQFVNFQNCLLSKMGNELPETINTEAMRERGIMGYYWSSLNWRIKS